MKQIKVMLWYDVEDFITPESDDALRALIDMMDALGIRSSLKIVGEKARVLLARGRTDILERVASHEVCYHTDGHSIHPTQTEYLREMGFAEGAAEFERREAGGFADVQRITGQFPTSYGQPGGSWAPHVFPVLRKWGIPTYLDSHNLLRLNDAPFRYGGILCLTKLRNTMRPKFTDESLAWAKKEFLACCERSGEVGLVSIYYHPCEFACEDFWDKINFGRGVNTPREKWQSAPLCGREEMLRRVGVLGEFLRWTLTLPGVEYITASESCRYEKFSPAALCAEDVRTAAAALTAGPDYARVGGRWLSAAENLSLLARHTLGLHLTPELFYGPEAESASHIAGEASPCALAEAVQTQFSRVMGYKQLPIYYQVGESRLSPVDLFENLRRAAAQSLPAAAPIPLTAGTTSLQPVRHVNPDYRWTWPIFPSDMDAEGIVRHAKLQTWTLKPADF